MCDLVPLLLLSNIDLIQKYDEHLLMGVTNMRRFYTLVRQRMLHLHEAIDFEEDIE